MRKLLASVSLCLLVFFSLGFANAASSVGTEAELRAQLAAGDTPITLTGDIQITTPLQINSGNVTIDLNGHKLTLGEAKLNMFEINGGATQVTIQNGTLDGADLGRLATVTDASLTLEGVTVQRGSTDLLEVIDGGGINRQVYTGGAIHAVNARLNILDTHFLNNHTKSIVPAMAPFEAPSGGAIYATSNTILDIKGGSFTDNYTGKNANGVNNGEGGAIKIDGGSRLLINTDGAKRTIFEGNHNYKTISNVGGLQGGAIEITSSIGLIHNADFIIKGGFDTGGAIKFEFSGELGNHSKVVDSTFKIVGGQLPTVPEPSQYLGTSGGAITTETSFLTIERSNFTMENKPNVAWAGGFIDVVGTGEFNLYDSNLTGNGHAWNDISRSSAKYGGAIDFENGASVKAHIKGTTIRDFTAQFNGSMISVGHVIADTEEYGGTTVDLVIEDSILTGARAYTYNRNSVGAGMYISEGSNVVIKGGEISGTQANYGGAVYNRGNLTLDNNAKIQYNDATHMAAGIFNDGYLNVHSATFTNNKKTDDGYFAGGYHEFSRNEHSGGAVYARKSVIIGSEANFSTAHKNDIRVIEGQSSVILSGPRNSVINVSISEVESAGDNSPYGRFFDENAHRHIGYLVGKGLTEGDLTASYRPSGIGSYQPTPEDAQKFHYVSNTVAADEIAAVDDHTSTAKWDYVFNPETKEVVLGQRARMIYHTNHQDATIEGGVADQDPNGQKLEQLYTIYDSGNGRPKVSVNNEVVTELTKVNEVPSLADLGFKNWYEVGAKNKPNFDPKAGAGVYTPYDFTEKTFTNAWHKANPTAEITEILSKDTENTLHTYAVYDKNQVTFQARKVWHSQTKSPIEASLKKGEEVLQTILLPEDGSFVSFEAVPEFDEKGDKIEYTVVETQMDVATNMITHNGGKYMVAIQEITNDAAKVENPQPSNRYFEIENTALGNFTVNKSWAIAGNDGANVAKNTTFQLFVTIGTDEPALVNGKTVTIAGNGSATFENLPLVINGNPAKYFVKEVGEENGIVTVEGIQATVFYEPFEGGVNVSNTAFESLKVKKVFTDETKKVPVTVRLFVNGEPTTETRILDESNQWQVSFDRLAHSGYGYAYSVKEEDTTGKVMNEGDYIQINGQDYSVHYSAEDGIQVITNKSVVEVVPGNPPVVDLPEAEIEVVPNDPPVVDLPIAEIEVVPGNPPVVELPEAEIEIVPGNPPVVDLPEAEIEVVPNNPPVVEKPSIEVPKKPQLIEQPKKPSMNKEKSPKTGDMANIFGSLLTFSLGAFATTTLMKKKED